MVPPTMLIMLFSTFALAFATYSNGDVSIANDRRCRLAHSHTNAATYLGEGLDFFMFHLKSYKL